MIGLMIEALAHSTAVAALALAVERTLPWREIRIGPLGHPVEWIGALIDRLERLLNRRDLSARSARRRGAAAIVVCLAAFGVPAALVSLSLRTLPLGWILEAMLVVPLLAQNQLARAVKDVADALKDDRLDDARRDAAKIVGRDVRRLESPQLAEAALESLAENASDAVAAPTLWACLLGLPGIVLYKTVNTADSMIGHRTPRYDDFGRVAAKLDDAVNVPASRLSAALFCVLVAARSPAQGREAWRITRRDAPRHASPNAGWPEAALAAALNRRLGSPRAYDGNPARVASMGEGEPPDADDAERGIRLYREWLNLLQALALLAALVAARAA